MLKNYLLVTFRNIRANKLFSAINIIGLAIGLSACFLIWQYVRFESSYDTFHVNKARLFRVPFEVWGNGERFGGRASGFAGEGYAMKAEFPEVKEFCRLVQTSLFTSDLGRYVANALEFSRVKKDGQISAFIEKSVWFADPGLLTMFSFPLIEGTKDALKEPNAIVLTKSIARKYFGNEPALGQDLRLNSDVLLKVTGVIDDVPANSHLQFDILISFATVYHRLGDMHDNWGWSVFYNYVLLEDHADVDALRAKLPALKDKYFGPETGNPSKLVLTLQPITDIHLRSRLDAEQSPVGSERTVYFLSILAVFILVVAWINYINLSTSKALQRSKEVGLRKTVGATRVQLSVQFLLDTLVINVLALTTAAGLVTAAWPVFETMVGKNISDILFTDGPMVWINAAVVFAAGVFVCGLYPALTLSSFNPAVVLKGGFMKSSSGTLLRKLMVSFQYVLAMLLLAGTITIWLQMAHLQSIDTGFTTDQVLVAESPAVFDSTASSRVTFMRNELMKLPGVSDVTATSDVPGRYIFEGAPIRRTKAEATDFFGTSVMLVDTSFFSTFDIPVVEGRMFRDPERMAFRRRDNESIPVLVNEEFVKSLRYNKPSDAIEERLLFVWGPQERYAQIIGVTGNHHQVSPKEQIRPIMYVQPEWLGAKYFAARVKAGSTLSVDQFQTVYKQAFPGHSFNSFFLDEHFNQQYREDQRFGEIFNTFTVLAIIITCMGLLGLSIFSVAQRTKEVSIRKVLGAPASSILLLFSFDFMRALLISYLISAPVIWWVARNWLQNFSSPISLRWEMFAFPPLLLVAITMITVVAVSMRAMVEAPVKALRQET